MSEPQMATLDKAQRRATLIRFGVRDLWRHITDAYEERDWIALGYESWDAYCDAEFGTSRIPLPREERREVVGSLREAGLSTRAIGTAMGVDEKTIRNDIRATAESDPGKSAVGTPSVTGVNGKVYARSPRQRVPEPGIWDASQPEPDTRPAPPKPTPVMLTLRTHKGAPVEYPQPQSKATFNQTSGEGISWAAWSWNPVTGCLHGCDYCYARALAARWTDSYPAGFTPLFHHERLDAPANTTIPAQHADNEAWRRVFVCSMADLYGRWVPNDWITQVHRSMLTAPQWQYILLTKFPARYVDRSDLPPGAWVGTSVDEQKRVRIAEDAFREIQGVRVKWLSLEPLREPLKFADLSMFDWVVIGGQTETMQPTGRVSAFAPPFDWVARIVAQAREAGCKVHLKPNLVNGKPGMQLPNEYPGSA